MNALGRGLASLISSRRSRDDAKELIEKIDSMEMIEGETAPPSGVRKKSGSGQRSARKTVGVIEEFGDLDHMQSDPMPPRPNVTPLPADLFDDEEGERSRNQVREEEPAASRPTPAMSRRLTVSEESDEAVTFSKKEKASPELDPARVTWPDINLGGPVQPIQAPDETTSEVEEAVPEIPVPTQPTELSPVPPAPSVPANTPDSERAKWDKHEERVEHVATGDIQLNPMQPRRAFDPQEMEELTSSLDQHGMLQPIVVRRIGGGKYELIAGERRLRAAKKLDWNKVPAVVRAEEPGKETGLVYALVENIQRQNLNPVEVAQAYQQLNESYGLTHEEIGRLMGTSRVAISNAVRVLQLPAEVQRGLAERKISPGHAKAILMIPDPEKQTRFYHHLVEEGLTVRKAEVRARRIQRLMKVDDPLRQKKKRGRHALAVRYVPQLEERYGFNSNVRYLEDKNRYEVTFRAYNEDEVMQLIGRLLGKEALPSKVDADVVGPEAEEDDEE